MNFKLDCDFLALELEQAIGLDLNKHNLCNQTVAYKKNKWKLSNNKENVLKQISSFSFDEEKEDFAIKLNNNEVAENNIKNKLETICLTDKSNCKNFFNDNINTCNNVSMFTHKIQSQPETMNFTSNKLLTAKKRKPNTILKDFKKF